MLVHSPLDQVCNQIALPCVLASTHMAAIESLHNFLHLLEKKAVEICDIILQN